MGFVPILRLFTLGVFVGAYFLFCIYTEGFVYGRKKYPPPPPPGFWHIVPSPGVFGLDMELSTLDSQVRRSNPAFISSFGLVLMLTVFLVNCMAFKDEKTTTTHAIFIVQ